jgi:isoquinoline 1-oxidoreductase alpha subunit
MIGFSVNGKHVDLDVDPSTPLLWVVREQLGLTGTKYGCGMAQCGACTVHIDGEAVRSCVASVERASGKKVTTIEGLSPDLSHAAGMAGGGRPAMRLLPVGATDERGGVVAPEAAAYRRGH